MPKIAITFDDAPTGGGALFQGTERTNLIIEALDSRDAQATIFVTAHDFEEENAAQRIGAYNDAGHLIANHTNTHVAASATPLSVFMAEVDRTTELVGEFSNYRSWFRFPYLDEGSTTEQRDAYRDALDIRGLSNGYVTADTFDWYLQGLLDDATRTGEYYNLEAIGEAYVEMIVSSAEYFDALGVQTLGRSPAHVLLLHENDLAALFIDDAIDALRANGWEIISADEAYADPLADMPVETLVVGSGKVAALALEATGDYDVLSTIANTQDGIDSLAAKYGAFDPAGPIDPPDPVDPGVITGTPGDDYLYGTSGDDVFESLEGSDSVIGSGGNDTIALGDGYDQVEYRGALVDYTFVRNADGSITVTKPNGGVDVMTGVDGFWFSDEEKWYDANELAKASGVTGITSGDDYIIATDGNDQIDSLEGEDVVLGSAGNDTINLGDGYDQVDYDGASTDYNVVRNGDGSFSVTKPDGGVDTLTGVDGFWFAGEEKWYDINDLATDAPGPVDPEIITGTSGDDYLYGTNGDDVFESLEGSDSVIGSGGNDTIALGDGYDQVEYTGGASDYSMVRNSDGSISVTKPDGGVDTMTGVDGFWFSGEEQWYPADELAKVADVTGITSGDDYIIATPGDDVINSLEGEDVVQESAGNDVINLGDGYDQIDYFGASSDYEIVKNVDGTVTVSKPDGGMDTLTGVDGFWFADEAAWYATDDIAIEAPNSGGSPPEASPLLIDDFVPADSNQPVQMSPFVLVDLF